MLLYTVHMLLAGEIQLHLQFGLLDYLPLQVLHILLYVSFVMGQRQYLFTESRHPISFILQIGY